METVKHDLVVIGSGPGGYVAAIRAAQLGMNVACIEREQALGGTCLRVGCIPSKALLESSEHYHLTKKEFAIHGIDLGEVSLNIPAMMKRKDKIISTQTKGIAFLFKKNKITRYLGNGRITGPGKVMVEGDTAIELEADKILIATGSGSAPLPGIELDGDRIGTSTEALSYPDVPKRLIVIGAGVIGLELGSVWRRLGSEVTVLEYLDRILPGVDDEIAKTAMRSYKKLGLKLKLGARVTSAKLDGDECVVEIDGADQLRADRVLLSVGRIPHTENLGLENVNAKLERGRIMVDENYVAAPGIYAIGDVIGGAMLAHKASEEGIACVERMANQTGHINYKVIPAVAYTDPEVASVGMTEQQLTDLSIPIKKGTGMFRGNGRAMAIGNVDGIIKVIAHKETDELLGVHICGPRAGDLITEAAVAMENALTCEQYARACRAHPSLAEAVKEAALAVDGKALHA